MKNSLLPRPDPRCQRGQRLSAAESEELEQKVLRNPADTEARLLLIGYYSRPSEVQRRRRNVHVLWLIEHWPQIPAGTSGIIVPDSGESDYERGKILWSQALQARPTDLTVASNAASFVVLFDADLGERWLFEGKSRNPTNADWALTLANYCELRLIHESTADARSVARRGLANYLEAFRLQREEAQLDIIWNMRQCAAAAGDTEVLRTLRLADHASDISGKQGDAATREHWTFTARGLVSLAEGNTGDAEELLRRAGTVAHISSFPATALARELVARGHRSVVLQYLRDCRTNWQTEAVLLSTWIELLETGKQPDWR